jgi:hypothetical protein
LRRAVENTPTALVTVAQQSNAKTCASLMLECMRQRVMWSGSTPLLRGMQVRVVRRKPARELTACFQTAALE